MHELAICQAIMDQVETLARDHQAKQVRSILLKIGPFAGVEPHLLELAYPLVSVGTVAEGAVLVIQPEEVRIRCPQCGEENVATPVRLSCPDCGFWRTELLSGGGMLLASVEMS